MATELSVLASFPTSSPSVRKEKDVFKSFDALDYVGGIILGCILFLGGSAIAAPTPSGTTLSTAQIVDVESP